MLNFRPPQITVSQRHRSPFLDIKNKKPQHFLIFTHTPNFYKMTRTKNIIYCPIPEKIQTVGVEDMKFQGVLKKEHVQILWSSKKEVDFSEVIEKKSRGLSMDIGFLVLKECITIL